MSITGLFFYLGWWDDHSVIGPDPIQGVLDVIGIDPSAAVLQEDGPEA